MKDAGASHIWNVFRKGKGGVKSAFDPQISNIGSLRKEEISIS